MAHNLVLRLLEEKQTEYEVSTMLWSPKMDILALSFNTGTVALYRLQWQKIWSAAPTEEDRLCGALAWRPDGKLLAAGDTSGHLIIRHIESSEAVHSEQLDSGIVSLSWHLVNDQVRSDESQDWDFLAKLPSLSKTYSYGGSGVGQEETEDCRRLDSSDTSVLVAGTQAGTVYVLINGYLLCMKLSLSSLFPDTQACIQSVSMTPDMKTISVVMSGGELSPSHLVTLQCPILSTCKPELLVLASKFCFIHGLLQYTSETIKQIGEAWEDILLNMDKQLSTYAENNPPGTVAADFLELLLFGVPTPQLKHFLHKEMSEKSLKKLGQSIELSYSNIQRLVLRYLGAVSQSLNFQVWELLGLARLGHKYSVLGITEPLVEAAVSRVQAFWAKGAELQQVIDESMTNFKAFFRWIYVEMLRLNEEPVTGDLSKVSQQDITFIAEFLQRFQPLEGGTGVSHVYLEKVGQYLREEDLLQPPDRGNNPWVKLLESTPELAETPFIIPVTSKTSLIKEHSLLVSSVTDIFSALARDLTPESQLLSQFQLVPGVDMDSVRQHTDETISQGTVTVHNSDQHDHLLYWSTSLPQEETLMLWIEFECSIIDSSFYTKDLITLLTEDQNTQSLVQIPVEYLKSHMSVAVTGDTSVVARVPLSHVSGVRTRVMDSLSGCQLAVSGQRGVSVCLFKNKKRLRIYDMEGEEEEEDETLDTSSFLSSQL